jgi:RNA recognition motif-containing protein
VFSKYGELCDVVVLRNVPVVFIEYRTADEANAAIRALNAQTLWSVLLCFVFSFFETLYDANRGQKITVSWATPKKGAASVPGVWMPLSPSLKKRVHVGNLPMNVTTEELCSLFQFYQPIVDVVIESVASGTFVFSQRYD